jgi:hypothetical protein
VAKHQSYEIWKTHGKHETIVEQQPISNANIKIARKSSNSESNDGSCIWRMNLAWNMMEIYITTSSTSAGDPSSPKKGQIII